jgi:hypothetical protein
MVCRIRKTRKKTDARSNGKLHSRKLQHSQRDKQYKWITKQVWVEIQRKPILWATEPRYVQRPRRVTWLNPSYKSQQDKVAEILRMSAQFGLRGSFEVLLRFSGTKLAEKFEFQYSIRDLTQHTDKLMAIAGVAYFIHQSTNFKYAAGIWTGTLPFNLLWTLVGSPKVKPSRLIPT